MRRLYQEVDELEARLGLHGERQIRECRMAARCEADTMKAQASAELTEAHNEVEALQTQVLEHEQSLKRNSRRFMEIQRQLKKIRMPAKQEHKRLADREHEEMEETVAATIELEVCLQEQHEEQRRILQRELEQRDVVNLPCLEHR